MQAGGRVATSPVGGAQPWIFDGHLDLAWNALQWNRDLYEPVHVLRAREAAMTGSGRGRNTVSLPALAEGSVRLCFATALARSSGVVREHVDFASTAQAHAVAWGQLAYYRALEQQGSVRRVTDLRTLHQHLATDGQDGVLGIVPCMEGADPVLEPEDLSDWHGQGVRMLSLSHYGPGRYAGGTGTSLGLADRGVALLQEMQDLGMILDLAHASDPTFWQALAAFDGPVVVSHANCRALVPTQRQLDDDQIRAVTERGGVIGSALDAWMLVPGWVKGATGNPEATLEHVADHIEHVCWVSGSTHHVAIGSDLDGGFGAEQSPTDIDTIADVGRLAAILQRRGFADADVEAVFHGNWLQVLERAWRAPQPTPSEAGYIEQGEQT